jgi:hypothetical protein
MRRETSSYFPLHSLNLRGNPFRRLTQEEWEHVAILPPSVAGILALGFTHLQILGPPGAGKTATLHALCGHFTQRGLRTRYLYLSPGGARRIRHEAGTEILLIDEFQRLGHRKAKAFIVGPTSIQTVKVRLVLSTHKDQRRLFQQLGLPLASVALPEFDPEFLKLMLNKRIAFFSDQQPPLLHFTDEAVLHLLDSHQGDWRTMEASLYEYFQRPPGAGKITAERLRRFRRNSEVSALAE